MTACERSCFIAKQYIKAAACFNSHKPPYKYMVTLQSSHICGQHDGYHHRQTLGYGNDHYCYCERYCVQYV